MEPLQYHSIACLSRSFCTISRHHAYHADVAYYSNHSQYSHHSGYMTAAATCQCDRLLLLLHWEPADALCQHSSYMGSCHLQSSPSTWHLQSIEVLEKPSGKLYYFSCPQWLETNSSARIKLYLGQRPSKPSSVSAAPLVAEEDWQSLAALPDQAMQDDQDSGVTGNYTVSAHSVICNCCSKAMCVFSSAMEAAQLYKVSTHSIKRMPSKLFPLT